jgi:predicted  nucleic acid-binding Zn-ribbon protein
MSEDVELMLLADVRSLESEVGRAQAARDKAQAKAADYKRDWYEAKSEFGSAMAKMREALRAAEKRELEPVGVGMKGCKVPWVDDRIEI